MKILAGNSSMDLLEAPYYKKSVVNIVKKQTWRLIGNVRFTNYNRKIIIKSIEQACFDKKYLRKYLNKIKNIINPYGDHNSTKKIKNAIVAINLNDKKWLIKKSISEMKNKIIVIAPHPDDETLGCGGLLLREKQLGSKIHWINVTNISKEFGWKQDQIIKKKKEIIKVASKYKFDSYYNLDLPTTKLDTLPLNNIIEKISILIKKIEPNIVYIPNIHDIHTDHQITAKAALACTKWFRYPFLKKCLSYETLSETHFSQSPQYFKPNVFVDITKFLNKKIEIMNIYKSEIEKFPFPRSETAIRSLANFRGSVSGFAAAEAFELLFERV